MMKITTQIIINFFFILIILFIPFNSYSLMYVDNHKTTDENNIDVFIVTSYSPKCKLIQERLRGFFDRIKIYKNKNYVKTSEQNYTFDYNVFYLNYFNKNITKESRNKITKQAHTRYKMIEPDILIIIGDLMDTYFLDKYYPFKFSNKIILSGFLNKNSYDDIYGVYTDLNVNESIEYLKNKLKYNVDRIILLSDGTSRSTYYINSFYEHNDLEVNNKTELKVFSYKKELLDYLTLQDDRNNSSSLSNIRNTIYIPFIFRLNQNSQFICNQKTIRNTIQQVGNSIIFLGTYANYCEAVDSFSVCSTPSQYTIGLKTGQLFCNLIFEEKDHDINVGSQLKINLKELQKHFSITEKYFLRENEQKRD